MQREALAAAFGVGAGCRAGVSGGNGGAVGRVKILVGGGVVDAYRKQTGEVLRRFAVPAGAQSQKAAFSAETEVELFSAQSMLLLT